MIYIYDILLNFCDCGDIYDFYEWNNNDEIENIKRIKLLHVDKKIFDDLLKCDVITDKDFLLKIFRTCEVYTGKKAKILDYCSLFSDGERVIAIEFNESGRSIYKSKLLLDEEEEIAILANNLETFSLQYKVNSKVLKSRFFTRNEIVMRNYLVKEIEECYKKKNYQKLHYLYVEYYEKESSSYVKMYNDLLNSMKDSLNEKHYNIYKLLKLMCKKKQV